MGSSVHGIVLGGPRRTQTRPGRLKTRIRPAGPETTVQWAVSPSYPLSPSPVSTAFLRGRQRPGWHWASDGAVCTGKQKYSSSTRWPLSSPAPPLFLLHTHMRARIVTLSLSAIPLPLPLSLSMSHPLSPVASWQRFCRPRPGHAVPAARGFIVGRSLCARPGAHRADQGNVTRDSDQPEALVGTRHRDRRACLPGWRARALRSESGFPGKPGRPVGPGLRVRWQGNPGLRLGSATAHGRALQVPGDSE